MSRSSPAHLSINHIPVLLTSSVVAHDQQVLLIDTQARIQSTLNSIAQWLKIRPDSPLVICDGSSYDFTPLVVALFPDANIECLAFENPQNLVLQYGRGYGEGVIVKYAMQHSQYIRATKAFAKCSAKLWVTNFDATLRSWNGRILCKGVFLDAFSLLKPTTWLHVDTRFYVVACDVYEAYLMNAHHRLGLILGESLEECFKHALCQHDLKHIMFHCQPVIEGVGGGIGRPYHTSLHRRIKEQLRLRLVRCHPLFASLF